ncbi:MAG: hypothetical protein HQL92_02320 [Magnetococcales bacterium]|nr:hypothetical protein [Magnetococcales bacterium]
MMYRRCKIFTIAMVLTFMGGGLPSGWCAVDNQQHEHPAATRSESGLTLNNGQPWQTDAPLRKGMEAIQRDIRDALPRVRSGAQTPRQYTALAKKMHSHLRYITKHCKLPPAVDDQLHRILAEVLQGAEAMESQNGQASGAAMVVHALDLYGRHFEHAGWKPLEH